MITTVLFGDRIVEKKRIAKLLMLDSRRQAGRRKEGSSCVVCGTTSTTDLQKI